MKHGDRINRMPKYSRECGRNCANRSTSVAGMRTNPSRKQCGVSTAVMKTSLPYKQGTKSLIDPFRAAPCSEKSHTSTTKQAIGWPATLTRSRRSCRRGAFRALDQGRVSQPSGPVRRAASPPDDRGVRRALPPRTESPRARQRTHHRSAY